MLLFFLLYFCFFWSETEARRMIRVEYPVYQGRFRSMKGLVTDGFLNAGSPMALSTPGCEVFECWLILVQQTESKLLECRTTNSVNTITLEVSTSTQAMTLLGTDLFVEELDQFISCLEKEPSAR